MEQPFSLQPIIHQVFSASQTANAPQQRSIKHIATSPPGYFYASASDGSFKLTDATVPDPIELEDLPISAGSLSPSKKPIERLAVLEDVHRLICLASGGSLSFHALPSLDVVAAGDAAGNAVVNSHVVKGVLSFAVDEFSANADGYLVAIMKRKGIALFLVSQTHVQLLHEVALSTQIVTAIALRDSTLCFADVERYSLMDIANSQLMPLLPISQDFREPGEPPKPDQRPAIVAVDNAEYLLASHTASSTLGVFISAETGDPCRGTIEWASNVRSLAIEGQHVIALLMNKSIEIHDIDTQQLTQIIQLPESMPDPRTLISSSPFLLEISWKDSPAASALKMVKVPLGKAKESEGSAFQTPPSSPLKAFSTPALAAVVEIGTFLQTRNAIIGLRPLGNFERADALLKTGKIREALDNVQNTNDEHDNYDYGRQLRGYFNLRAGLHYFIETDFDEAAACLSRACGDGVDPRLLLRAFADLCPHEWNDDSSEFSCEVFMGAQKPVHTISKGVDSVIMANLYRNYSPHIKPEEETLSLQEQLGASARQMIRLVLASCHAQDFYANIDVKRAVVTALAKLAAEAAQPDECLAYVQAGPVSDSDLIQWLRDNAYYSILARVYDQLGLQVQLIRLWLEMLDSEEPLVGTRQIAQAILYLDDEGLKREFAMVLVARDQQVGLHVLWSLATRQSGAQACTIYKDVAAIKGEAAELYLEGSIFRVTAEDANLSSAFAGHCLAKLQQASLSQESGPHEGEEAEDRSHSLPDDLLHLVKQPEANYRPIQTRLLFMLFLATHTSYEISQIRTKLEKLPDLAFERAIVYGKLGLHRQALATLVKQAKDVTSAEIYCLQRGVPLADAMVRKILSQLGLPQRPWRLLPTEEHSMPSVGELMQILIDLLLNAREAKSSPLLTRFLTSQAAHLDTQLVLDRVPEDATIADMTSFFTRGLSRSLHQKHEIMLLKPLAVYRAMEASEALYREQCRVGPIVQDTLANFESGEHPESDRERKEDFALQSKDAIVFGEKENDVTEVH